MFIIIIIFFCQFTVTAYFTLFMYNLIILRTYYFNNEIWFSCNETNVAEKKRKQQVAETQKNQVIDAQGICWMDLRGIEWNRLKDLCSFALKLLLFFIALNGSQVFFSNYHFCHNRMFFSINRWNPQLTFIFNLLLCFS